MEIGYNEVKWS